jgi:Carboxypeptidase regulatory-like domain
MKKYLGVLLLFALSAAAAWGQATAQIHGVVQDMSGAAIGGATVKATQTETGINRTVTTEAGGEYLLSNLPLGPYQIEVSKDGFSTTIQTGVVLQVGSDPTIPIALKVGAVSERVSVEANASQVETSSVGVGTVIETQRILDLPLNGRQPTDLITLSGLAVQTGTSATYNMSTGVNISVAGGTSYSIQYNLDGASHLDTYDGTNMPLPFPDALQEFKLITSTQDASGGGHSGASVNGVTKSGTNTIHGDAFEFFRNSSLNGRDSFSAKSDQLKRNQFGGVIGGPIKKDTLFFFTGYQGTVTRQTPSGTVAFVPTAAELTGDFSAYAANKCGPITVPLDATGHLLSISPAALKIASYLPQGTGPCGQTLFGLAFSENRYQVPVRLDYQLSAKQSLFARYLLTKIDQKVPYSITPNVLASTGTGADDMGQSLALGDTYVISPTTVNSFRVFGNRVGSYKPAPQYFSPADVGINAYSYIPKFTSLLVVSGFSLGVGANFATSTTGYTNFGFNDDVNIVHGAHQISVGGSAMRAILVGNSYAWASPFMVMVGMPAFFAGSFGASGAGAVHEANPNPNYTTQNFMGLYAGDTWKVTPKLTVNYGIRWNPFFPMQFIQSDVTDFSLSAFYAGKKSTVIPTAPPGFTYPGDPGFNGRSGLNHNFGHPEPRIGFAWDPGGDGKMAIRGGVGIAYDFIRQDLHQNSSSQAPFRITVLPGPTGTLDNPFGGIGGNPFPYQFNPKNPVFPSNIAYQGFYPIPPDLRTTEQYSWNLGIQRQITANFFASATYVGTHLIHTWGAVDLNPAQYIPGNCIAGQYGLTAAGPCTQASNVNNRRLLELTNPSAGNILGSVTQTDDGGTQRYNGLLLNANWRKGSVNLGGNYTWSHCTGLPIATLSNLSSTDPHQAYQNTGPVGRNLDMGDCYSGSLDVRHIANITLVASTPKYSGTWARRLGTGWTLSTIYTVRSGSPVTLWMGTDVAMNGLYQGAGAYPVPQRPNQVLADTAAPNQGQSCSPAPCVSYFNPAAFASPTPGTYGNMGVASLRAPGFWEWDQTISRQFRITETQRVEFRAEAFNLTNSVRLYLPTNGGNNLQLGNNQFGQITTDASTTGSTSATGSGGRIVQLALKYVF